MITHNYREIRYRGPWDEPHVEQVYVDGVNLNLRNLAVYGERDNMLPRRDGIAVDEFRHPIYLRSCSGRVENIYVADGYGDGVQLSAKHPHFSDDIGPRCHDLVVDNLVVDNCRRNALALIGVENSVFTNLRLTNTWGNPGGPCAQIDFEPDNKNHTNRFLYFRHGYAGGRGRHQLLCENKMSHNVLFEDFTFSADTAGWAARGLFGPGEPWPYHPEFNGYSVVFVSCKFWGPVHTFDHALFIDCEFHADPRNRQRPHFAIDMYMPNNVKFLRPKIWPGLNGTHRFDGGNAVIVP